MFKSLIRKILLDRKTPHKIRERFTLIDNNELEELRKSFLVNHFTKDRGYDNNFLRTQYGAKAMEDALVNRLTTARDLIIPWISSNINLYESKILEIGCGSGAGTIALAEQAKFVIGLDIDLDIMKVAKDRCRIHGINNVEFQNSGEINISKNYGNEINVVIFYASLEHMLYKERKAWIQKAWNMLPNNGYFIIIDSPNRLFYYDGHTTDLPFYNWLPDHLSFEYIKTRTDHFLNHSDIGISKSDLMKKGRGISFHDLEIALSMPINEFKIIDSLCKYDRKRKQLFHLLSSLNRLLKLRKQSLESRYIKLMKEYQPDLHPGFLQSYINIIIQKN